MWSGDGGNWNQPWPSAGGPGPGMPPQAPSNAVYQQNFAPQLPQNQQQVDWAVLAQQWIQMQQQPPQQQQQPLTHLPQLNEIPPPSDVMATNHNNQMGNDIVNKPYFNKNPIQVDKHPNYWNNEPPPNWAQNFNQPWGSVDSGPKKTFDYGHSVDSQKPTSMNNTQSFDYNHGSTKSFQYDDQQESYSNKYWDESLPESEPRSFHEQQEQWEEPDVAPPQSDEILRRKSLPSWIREGLEKMEREKQKKMDMQKNQQEKLDQSKNVDSNAADSGEPSWQKKSRFDSESDDDNGSDHSATKRDSTPVQYSHKKSIPLKQNPPTPEPSPPPMTPAEKEHDLMIRVRKMMTEILLDVTNREIKNIVCSVLNKVQDRSVAAKQLARSSALASIASNLGLGSYESESGEDTDAEVKQVDNSESGSDIELLNERLRSKKVERHRVEKSNSDEEIESKSKSESKSVSDRDINASVQKKWVAVQELSDSDVSQKKKYHFESKYSAIPGLSIPSTSEDNEKSDSDALSSKKYRRQSSLSSSESKERKNSRSRSRDRKRSRIQSSRNRDRKSRSRSSSYSRRKSKDYKKSKRQRSRSHERHRRSRSRSRGRKRKSRSRSGSYSSESRSKKFSSRSRDHHSRGRERKEKRRSKSRSTSPRKSSKRKSGKSKFDHSRR